MNESHVTSFTPDLRVSAKPAIAVLIGIGVLFGFAAGRPEYTNIMSPVAMLTPHSAAVCCMEAAMAFRISISSPSSRIKEADRARGRYRPPAVPPQRAVHS